jgi:hypothetical protein
MFISDHKSEFFHPGCRIQGQKRYRTPDRDPQQRNLVFLTLIRGRTKNYGSVILEAQNNYDPEHCFNRS